MAIRGAGGGDFSIKNLSFDKIKETGKEGLTKLASKLPFGGRYISQLLGTKDRFDELKTPDNKRIIRWDTEGNRIDLRDATQNKEALSPHKIKNMRGSFSQLRHNNSMLEENINSPFSPYAHGNDGPRGEYRNVRSMSTTMNYTEVNKRLHMDTIGSLSKEMGKDIKDIDLSKFKDVDFDAIISAWEQEAKEVRGAGDVAYLGDKHSKFIEGSKSRSEMIALHLEAGAAHLKNIRDQIKPSQVE